MLDRATLPTDPDKLLKIADEQYEKGGVGLKNSLVALQRCVEQNPEWASSRAGYAVHWRLARTYSELCAEDDRARKAQNAQAGVEAGRRAVELDPDGVEGNYYLAQVLGYSVQDRKGDRKEIVSDVIRLAERAVEINERYDHAGPLRLLGALYAKAPAPPLSIGDPEKAVKLLRRAVELDGGFPANLIYLADALVADEQYQEAEKAVREARALLEDRRWDRYRRGWTEELSRIEKKLRARQG